MLNGKRVLITTGGGIGDMIMFTPSMYALKQMYPNMYLSLLTRNETADIVEGLPWLDEVIRVQRGIPFSRFRCFPKIAKQDYIIFTDWQPHVLPWAYLCRVPHLIGKPRWQQPLNRCLDEYLTYDVMKSPEYAAETNRKIFSEALHIDIVGDMTRTYVSMPSKQNMQDVETKLQGIGVKEDFILISPYSSKYNRDLPKDVVLRLAQQVEAMYQMPVIIGGATKEENDLLVEWQRNLLNRTSLLEMIALIEKAKLLITVDSGPMHIGSATKTPVLAIFNTDMPSRWAPKHHCTYIDWNDETLRKQYLDAGFILVNPEDITDIRNVTADLIIDVLQKSNQLI